MIMLNGMLIVEGANIMRDNIATNQGEQLEPEIWLDPVLGEQSIVFNSLDKKRALQPASLW